MSGPALEIPNLDSILAQIGELDDLIGELAEPTEEVLQLLKERMQEYPPERPNQRYVRTEDLKNGWDEYVILAGDRLGLLRNNVPYGHWVQSEADQAWMHRGRWQTDKQVIDEKEDQAARIYEDYLRQRLAQIK